MRGKCIPVVQRLFSLAKMGGFDSTEDLAHHLVEAVKQACGDDPALFEIVRHKVLAFTPDGAPNEQLAGKLSMEQFPGMRVVLRCVAHAIEGALSVGWQADPTAEKVTKVVKEVAAYMRNSDRFALRVGSKMANESVAAFANFSYAPHRFSSLSRPLARFVWTWRSVIEVLSIEVSVPTSAARKLWASNLLAQIDGPMLLAVGMLADLSEDCTLFLRRHDTDKLDPIQAAIALEAFQLKMRSEYGEGRMWLRETGTYAVQMAGMLEETSRHATCTVHLASYRPPTISPRCLKLSLTLQNKGVAQSQVSCRPLGLGAMETIRASLEES